MKLNTINLGGKKYPLLCDLNVLETLQDEFGTVSEFERKLLGVRYVKDSEGNLIYDEDGNARMELVEPSIKAIKIALVEMVNEGIAYEAYSQGRSWEMIDELDVMVMCTIPYSDLANILHDEYKRCFLTKKSTPREKKAKSQK